MARGLHAPRKGFSKIEGENPQFLTLKYESPNQLVSGISVRTGHKTLFSRTRSRSSRGDIRSNIYLPICSWGKNKTSVAIILCSQLDMFPSQHSDHSLNIPKLSSEQLKRKPRC